MFFASLHRLLNYLVTFERLGLRKYLEIGVRVGIGGCVGGTVLRHDFSRQG